MADSKRASAGDLLSCVVVSAVATCVASFCAYPFWPWIGVSIGLPAAIGLWAGLAVLATLFLWHSGAVLRLALLRPRDRSGGNEQR